ncbi:hypothetical protein [Rhizobium mongolense]|uniref:hypothetical protein n=1 Tax=Rhizobium mongolense TaxID=57676 RepID=UPI00161FC0E2|nr:hypothetical protein [Rhizobium mongolense]
MEAIATPLNGPAQHGKNSNLLSTIQEPVDHHRLAAVSVVGNPIGILQFCLTASRRERT